MKHNSHGSTGRGSSPHVSEHHGKDDWVRGIRWSNGTSAEFLANNKAERLVAAPSADVTGHDVTSDDRS
ncbi:MAG: hypothetical protein MUE68_02565 [Bacteroidetes bacterium]|nr:hypothetical protein [Bacteroidota bacterium]